MGGEQSPVHNAGVSRRMREVILFFIEGIVHIDNCRGKRV